MNYNVGKDVFVNKKDKTYLIKISGILGSHYIVLDLNKDNSFYTGKKKYMTEDQINQYFDLIKPTIVDQTQSKLKTNYIMTHATLMFQFVVDVNYKKGTLEQVQSAFKDSILNVLDNANFATGKDQQLIFFELAENHPYENGTTPTDHP